MARRRLRINHSTERCVLSDTLPYEVPITFTNRHFYQFLRTHKLRYGERQVSWVTTSRPANNLIHVLCGLPINPGLLHVGSKRVGGKAVSITTYQLPSRPNNVDEPSVGLIPFRYRINHKEADFRDLAVPHPRNQLQVVDFYERTKELLLYHTAFSPFSIRHPSKVADYTFYKDRTHYELLGDDDASVVEQDGMEYEQLRSFFVYKSVSNVHKFYESYRYQRAEKKYQALLKLDISKCFDSIYTHSIGWAILGKDYAKRNLAHQTLLGTFADQFDSLMQRMNHNETNGIIIGPDFSRLFAEIILQAVDVAVERELRHSDPPLKERVHYEIYRYVDDYFIFYNCEETKDRIVTSLQHHLREYKLHLNSGKARLYEKPLITEISRAKERISRLFNDRLKYDLEEVEIEADGAKEIVYRGTISLQSKYLIVQFKTILKECEVDYRDILNYTLAVGERRIERILVSYGKIHLPFRNQRELVNALFAICEFVFFIYSSCPTPNATVRLCRIVRAMCEFLRGRKISHEARHRVFKKIFDDVRLVLDKIKMGKHTQIETLYLLVLLAELGRNYRLEEEVLASYFKLTPSTREPWYSSASNLNYFELTVALFYMRDFPRYGRLRSVIENGIVAKLVTTDRRLFDHTELCLLCLDTLVCPFISSGAKVEILNSIGITDPVDQREIIAPPSTTGLPEAWFTTWNGFDLGKALDAKKGREVY